MDVLRGRAGAKRARGTCASTNGSSSISTRAHRH
jgi:hypothetical protein